MKHGGAGLAKRVVSIVTLALFMSQVSLPVWEGAVKAWADVGTNVAAPLKSEVGLEETDELAGGGRKSNVLFLIEATAAMSFTPKGVLPQVQMTSGWDLSFVEGADWNKTRERFEYGPEEINRMMKEATFGMGALPAAWSGLDLRPERNLYGRDPDDTNNFVKGDTLKETMELNADNYYFPFVSDDNPIANGLYKGQKTGLEIGFADSPEVWPYSTVERSTAFESKDRAGYPTNHDYGHWDGAKYSWYYDTKAGAADKGYYKSTKPKNKNGERDSGASNTALHIRHTAAGYGDQEIAPYNYIANTRDKVPYPYALVFKDPAHWRTPPAAWGPDDLVPNDSRMYQVKLVLWRLLSDPELFKNIRFGMATTYLSPSNVELGHMSGTHHGVVNARQDYNGIFKVSPFGANVWTIAFFDAAGKAYVNNSDNIKKAIKDGNFVNGFRRVKFSNGILNAATTGNMETHYSLFGQYYPMWMNAKVQSYYDTAKVPGDPKRSSEEEDGWWSSMGLEVHGNGDLAGQYRDRPLYKLMNRASLWLPIEKHDYKWTKGGKTITQIDKFKLWINGVADIKSAGSTATDYTGGVLWGDDFDRGDSFKGNRAGQFYYYNDPEIGIAGNFALAQAIFPDPTKYHPTKKNVPLKLDRDFYYNEGYVWFSKKDRPVTYKIDKRRYSQEQDWSGKPRAYFNAGTGEAAGSVIDFFSPKRGYTVKGAGSKAQTYANEDYDQLNIADGKSGAATVKTPKDNLSDGDLAEVSFPITNACEDNWVVVVASGCEPKITDGDYEYPAWKAVKNLFDATNSETSPDFKVETGTRKAIYAGVTMLDKNTKQLKTIDLEKPIMTRVIGIVADPEKLKKDDPSLTDDDPVIKEVKRMRLNLIRMANAGRGIDASEIEALTVDNMYDAPYQPDFASNSVELLESFRRALIAVNKSDAVQPGKGTLVEAPPSEGEDLPSTFSTSYRVVQGDQWVGGLTRYFSSADGDGFSILERDWEFGAKLLERRGNGDNPATHRGLKYWDKDSGTFKLFGEGDAAFSSLLGINDRLSPSNLPGGTFGTMTPDRALYWWLQGYDYSYARGGGKYPRSSMLSDFGNSGIVYADFPSVTANNGFTGYREWAEDMAGDVSLKGTERLYAQSNDGILHVIVPKTGMEESAVLPPPSLLPSRLASLKTYAAGEIRLWHDVKGDERTLGVRSEPGYTLDGPLRKRRFDLSASADGSEWKTLLVGMLGRGGSGIYVIDITKPADPKFHWYKENLGGSFASMNSSDSEPSIGPADSSNPYGKLGYNSPKPAMGVTGITSSGTRTNFIALAGGSQSYYDPAQNGGEGAALLFINPKDGGVIRAFDSASAGTGSAKVGSAVTGYAPHMGMMLSEPTLLRSRNPSNSFDTGQVFAADNRGSIFTVSMEAPNDENAITALEPSEWNIRAVATLQRTLSAASDGSGVNPRNYALPYGLCADFERDKIWLGGGTSNAMVKVSEAAPDGELKNEFQMLFGFRVPDDIRKTYARGDLKELNDTAGTKLEPNDTRPGWYFRLSPEGDMRDEGEEYVSAKPVLLNDTMYIPTFREKDRLGIGNENPCGAARAVSGEARLYALDIKTGGAARWRNADNEPVKYITFEDSKIVDISVRHGKDTDYLGLTIDDFGDSNAGEVLGDQQGTGGDDKKPEIKENRPGGSGIPPETTLIYYWLRK